MSRLIQQRERIPTEAHEIYYPVYSDGGFAFPCSSAGFVDSSTLNPAALENFEMCAARHAAIAQFRTIRGHDIRPGIIRCDCGRKLEVWDHFDVDCDRCERCYNSSGQLLAPRAQWGEETGETAFDYDLGAAGYHGSDEP